MSSEEYKKMKTSILEDVRSDLKDWLASKLHFTNEPTLHDRLKELLSDMRNEILTGIVGDEDQFIRDAKNSRNYYTHYDPVLKKKAKMGTALFLLTEKLKVLLLCAILNEASFTKVQIERFLKERTWVLFNHILPKNN